MKTTFPGLPRPLAGLWCVLFLALTAIACGDEPKAEPGETSAPKSAELELTTERVIVFKDGYALIIKRGVAHSDEEGQVFTDEVPDAAVLGSFWAVPGEGRIVSTLAGWKTTEQSETKEVPCTQTIEILLSNKGKEAKVELLDKTLYSGVIHEVLVDKTESVVAEPVLSALDFSSAGSVSLARSLVAGTAARQPVAKTHTLTTINGSFFVLRTEDGDVFLPVSQVRSLVVKDMKTTVSKTVKSSRREKRLTFTFDGKQKKQELTLMYFRPGIRWIPTYRVQLSEDEKKPTARMSLQAELINEAEDLKNVPIDIVVGVPNFRFRETPSPLVLEAALRNTLMQAAPQLMGAGNNTFSNALYSQRASEFRREGAHGGNAEGGGDFQLPDELTAAGSQDLFVYKLPKQSLAAGERSAVTIFDADVAYRHLYTWDVQVTRNDIEAAPSGSGIRSPLKLAQNQVWHQVALINSTSVPWTTGAAMIMQGNQPLAQELLTYTPPKDEVRVPLTIAVDLRGQLTEQETGRQLQAVTWGGYNYARISKQMSIVLRNSKSVAVETEVTVRVGGKVVEASDDGEIILAAFNSSDWENYQGHPAVNNSSIVKWKVKLKPGETFEPTIDYHYFARH